MRDLYNFVTVNVACLPDQSLKKDSPFPLLTDSNLEVMSVDSNIAEMM